MGGTESGDAREGKKQKVTREKVFVGLESEVVASGWGGVESRWNPLEEVEIEVGRQVKLELIFITLPHSIFVTRRGSRMWMAHLI